MSKAEKNKVYSLEEGVALVKELSFSKFDGAVEAHIKVKGDAVRGTVVLPHGTGKTKKVAVADDATIEAIAAGKLDFDVLLATPAQMPKLAKFAKVLGPKGLMPSPKAGTVTDDIEKVKNEISGGRVEYRADKTGVIHLSIGRLSFKDEQLVENFRTIEAALGSAKVVTVSLAPTMGPGIKVQFGK
ncbi:MAG TPA: 50S ribosomal protein L1 [Verrucomicrobiae bacterium]|nr:50S ribosomal protein L1 [Verrucomicrobiae bacterium]